VSSVLASVIAVFLVAKFALGQLEIPFLTQMAKTGTVSLHQQDLPSRLADKHAEALVLPNVVQPERITAEPEVLNSKTGRPQPAIVSGTIDVVPARSEQPGSAQSREEPHVGAGENPAMTLSGGPEKIPEILRSNSSSPGMPGQITVRPGDNLETMIRRIYGTFDHEYLKSILRANHQITNPRVLEVGKSLNFPALPVKAGPLLNHGWWVQVAERDTLDEAYQLLRTYPPSAPPVCMLPCGNPRDRLKFVVVLRDCCADQQSAELALNELPSALASEAKILTKGD
jgi:hypothetical protein